MNETTLCKNIAALRKGAGLTQEALATKLGLTYQAVSKWENGLSCPDVQLLPEIADIFNISIDQLFGREPVAPAPAAEPQPEAEPAALIKIESDRPVNVTYEDHLPPWEDDNTLYIALYRGHELINEDAIPLEKVDHIPFTYEGPALNIRSILPVVVEGDVQGDVLSGGDVKCENVEGDVSAGGDIDCGSVSGHVSAAGDVDCGGVEGNVFAGGDVDSGSVEGCVYAGDSVDCGSVEGSIIAGDDVDCSSVGGSVFAGGDADFSTPEIDRIMSQMQEQLRHAQEQVRRSAEEARRNAENTRRKAEDVRRNNAYRNKDKNFEIKFDMDEVSSEQFREKVDGLVNGVEKMLDGLFDKLDFGKNKKKNDQ